MHTDHRRPLAAYCFVVLACTLVMWQPSLATNVAGPGPVVKILTQNDLFPSEILATVTGGDLFEAIASPAPEGQLPDAATGATSRPGSESAGDPQPASAPAATNGDQATAAVLDAHLVVSDGPSDGDGRNASGDEQADGPGRADHPDKRPEGAGVKDQGHPGKEPRGKPEGHPGKAPKGAGWKGDHPGKGPQGKPEGHPGKGPQGKPEGHPGNGPKGNGWKHKDHPGKSQQHKDQKHRGQKRHGSQGKR